MKKIILIFLSIMVVMGLTGCKKYTDKKEIPIISDKIIQSSVDTMAAHEEVKEASIEIKGKEIKFSALLDLSVDKEKSKELGEYFVYIFSFNIANESKNLKGPTKDDLGDIYDYYNIDVNLSHLDKETLKGIKKTTEKKITWKNESI